MKKIASFCLVVVLGVTLVAVPALAADPKPGDKPDSYVIEELK